jgi:predicted transcriptional regulator
MSKQAVGPLTESQREIMEIFWELGQATVSDIHDRISSKRVVARNTIQTLIVRLEEKGWLQHVEQGCKFVYSAAAPRTQSLGARVSHMVDRMFGGSPEQLVNALLEYRGLSESELQNIRDMIAQAESSGSSSQTPSTSSKPKKGPKR